MDPQQLHNFFDRVVLVNLDRRADRLEWAHQEMMKCRWPFRPAERFRAVDATVVPVPIGWRSGDGAWGCMQSHRQILEQAIMDGVRSLLVMEDDITFRDGTFRDEMEQFLEEVPGDWDQLMIGGQLFRDSINEPVSKNVRRVSNCQRTHCYAVRGRYMRDLYSRWCSSYGHCDHIMGPMQKDYRVYAPARFLAGQGSGRSDISWRDNAETFWDGSSVEYPIYWIRGPASVVKVLRERQFHDGCSRSSGACPEVDEFMNLPVSPRVKALKLKSWITSIQWQARTKRPEKLPFVWHPKITEEIAKSAIGGNLVICDLENDGDAVTLSESLMSAAALETREVAVEGIELFMKKQDDPENCTFQVV